MVARGGFGFVDRNKEKKWREKMDLVSQISEWEDIKCFKKQV